jgi:hypothetical protein
MQATTLWYAPFPRLLLPPPLPLVPPHPFPQQGLERGAVTPSSSQTYTLKDFTSALQNAFGATPMITCQSSSGSSSGYQLLTIMWCVDNSGQVRERKPSSSSFSSLSFLFLIGWLISLFSFNNRCSSVLKSSTQRQTKVQSAVLAIRFPSHQCNTPSYKHIVIRENNTTPHHTDEQNKTKQNKTKQNKTKELPVRSFSLLHQKNELKEKK